MGLREKVALAMLVSIYTQIVCNHCMPRGHSNYPLKSCTKNAKSPELFRFPDVEYPSEYEAGEYYRFLSDYHQPNICENSCSPQTQNLKRQAKFKRKYDMNATPKMANSFTECDCLSHPYCFKKSSYFPEVEYPLSARDTWIPSYWSRLQDAKRNINLQKNIPSLISTTTQISNCSTDYNNSPLSSLIKALNTKKKSSSTTPISDTNYTIPNPNEVDTFPVYNASDTSGVINSDIDPDISIPRKDTISTTKNTTYSDINPESVIPTKNMICDIVTSTTNTENNGPNLYIPGEGNINDFIPTAKTAINSGISLNPSVSNKEPLDHVVATSTENNNPASYSPGDGIQNNTESTTKLASNSDISFGPSVINKDLLDYVVATTTKPINNSNKVSELPVIKEDGDLLDNVVPLSTSATNDNFKPKMYISKNYPSVDNIATTANLKNRDDALEFPIFKENDTPLYNTVSTTINETNRNIKSDYSVSKIESFMDIVKTTTNMTSTKNSDIIMFEDKGAVDNISSITTSITNCDIKPETSALKNDQLSDFVTTTTTNTRDDDFIREMPITKENKDPLDSIATVSNNVNKSESVSVNEPLGDIVTATSKPVNGDIPELPILKKNKDPVTNIIPIILSVTNSDIKPNSFTFNNDQLSDILTTSTNTNNYICQEIPIIPEDKAPLGIDLTKTSSSYTDFKSKSSVTNDPLGDILPSSNKTKNSNIILEVLQLTEGTAPVDNIAPTTTSATDSVIQPDLSMFKNDLLGDIMTSTTNKKNGDIPILKEDKRLCVSNVSTIVKTKSDIKPETSTTKNEPLGDIVISTTNAKISEVIPKLPILIDYKDLIDNNISTTISPANRPTNPETSLSQYDPLGDIVTSTKNTNTSDIISELPTVSTITTLNYSNSNATPETFITKNDPRDNCLESNSTMTTTVLPVLKTPMVNNSSDFTPIQNLPEKDKTSDGIITSTTTRAKQTTIDTHSEQFSTKEAPMSSTDMTLVASSTTNSILTTPSPLEFINPNNDIQPNYSNAPNSQSNTGPSNFTNDWITSTSQSTGQTVPEYSDDWIIYVENGNVLPTRGNFCDGTFIIDETKNCENSASPNTNTEKDNCSYMMLPTVPDYLDDSWLLGYDTGNTTQDLAPNGFEPVYFSVESNTNEMSIPGANDTGGLFVFMDDPNSILKYRYVDDASVLCTEMPYDLVVYPEYVNDIRSASTNYSYVLNQPI